MSGHPRAQIQRVRTCHERHLIYRDIKPDNFLMGKGANSTTVYMIGNGGESAVGVGGVPVVSFRKKRGLARFNNVAGSLFPARLIFSLQPTQPPLARPRGPPFPRPS